MANLTDAIRLTRILFDAGLPVFWHGHVGIGKTEGAQALARDMGLQCHDWRANLREPVDARGLPVPDLETGTTHWLRPSDLPFVGNDQFPEEGLLFCDELNTAAPSMQVVGMQLVNERRVGEHKLKTGWRILAAGNRQSDRAAAQRMPSALANRFAHIDVEPDVTAWGKWAVSANLEPVVLAFLRFRPELLHKYEPDARAFPTPRAWEKVARVINAPDADRFALVAAIVGEGAAAEVEGFVRVYRNLPTIAEIIANPDGINIPDEPATQYAVASALARKADAKNFAPILKFANRALGPEFNILLVTDAIGRDVGLKQTRPFVDWAVKHQDVVL